MLVTRENLDEHQCSLGGSWWEYDAQGIELCRVCADCQKVKLGRYRPEILPGYDAAPWGLDE